MVIRLRKRTDCEKLIFAILAITFLEGILSIFIPQIHPIFYLTDVFNLVLLCAAFFKGFFKKLYKGNLRYFWICFIIFSLCTVMSMIADFSNIVLHLWGIRRIYSNFIFFFACVFFERSDELRFVEKLFVLNLLISILEVMLGYRQDYFGGIYGVSFGDVNGPLHLLLLIIATKSIIYYINKKKSLTEMIFVLASIVMIAAFAELKVFFVECVLLIVLCSLVTKFSFKKLLLFVAGAIGAAIGMKFLFVIFPDINRNMFSAIGIWNYLTNPGGYVGQFAGNAGDMNRLAFWDKSMDLLPGTFDKLFGLGIGNCEYINFLNLQSAFYASNFSLHYYMFPLAMILLQQGIIGMTMYILLFVTLFLAVKRQKNTIKNGDVSLYQIVEVLCLMAFVITVYDTSLFGKGGLLFFYVLSLPFNQAGVKRYTRNNE